MLKNVISIGSSSSSSEEESNSRLNQNTRVNFFYTPSKSSRKNLVTEDNRPVENGELISVEDSKYYHITPGNTERVFKKDTLNRHRIYLSKDEEAQETNTLHDRTSRPYVLDFNTHQTTSKSLNSQNKKKYFSKYVYMDGTRVPNHLKVKPVGKKYYIKNTDIEVITLGCYKMRIYRERARQAGLPSINQAPQTNKESPTDFQEYSPSNHSFVTPRVTPPLPATSAFYTYSWLLNLEELTSEVPHDDNNNNSYKY